MTQGVALRRKAEPGAQPRCRNLSPIEKVLGKESAVIQQIRWASGPEEEK